MAFYTFDFATLSHLITVDGRTILTLITLYSVIVFSLNMSWNFTTAEFSNDVRYVLEIMTLLLHAIFVVCSFFM